MTGKQDTEPVAVGPDVVDVTVRANTQVNVDGVLHEGGETVTVAADLADEWVKAEIVDRA